MQQKDFEQLIDEFSEALARAEEYFCEHELSLITMPFAVTFYSLAREKKAFISMVDGVLRGVKTSHMLLCLLSDRDRRGFEVRTDELMRITAHCSVSLSYQDDDVSVYESTANGAYSASFLSIKMPLHTMLLSSIGRLIVRIGKKPDNDKERLSKLGRLFSESVKRIFWKDTYDRLPLSGSSADISPIYSISDDAAADEHYVSRFCERYYLSAVPVSDRKIQRDSGELIQALLNEYTSTYGKDIHGLKMFTKQGGDNIFREYIDEIDVIGTEAFNSKTLKAQAADLRDKLSDRIREAYRLMLSSETMEELRNGISRADDLLESISRETIIISNQQRNERLMTRLYPNAVESDVTSDDMKEIVDEYISVVRCNDVTDEVAERMIDCIIRIVMARIGSDRENFIRDLRKMYDSSDAEKKKKIISGITNGLSSSMTVDLVKDDKIMARISAGDNDNSGLLKDIMASGKAGRTEHRIKGMNDRIDILCLTEPFSYDVCERPESTADKMEEVD